MYLDISPCRSPDPAQFESLLLEKLQHIFGNQPPPHRINYPGGACCFLIQRITETYLFAADPGNGEQALVGALQCLQQQQMPPDTQVTLLSAEPPPALAWLSQHQALNWYRCQVLTVNNDYGIFIEDTDNRLFTTAPAQQPGRLQRSTPVTKTGEELLTEEEQQFFSHL